jgi:hypothetical protein
MPRRASLARSTMKNHVKVAAAHTTVNIDMNERGSPASPKPESNAKKHEVAKISVNDTSISRHAR